MIDFQTAQFLSRISGPLPGMQAQKLMAPSVRFDGDVVPDPHKSRESSVLIALFPYHGNWGTVFIERSLLGPHGGQISLPGGKREPEDSEIVMTALREAREEVGLNPDEVQILGRLTELYVPNSNYRIVPFVGLLSREPEWQPSDLEVNALVLTSLNELFSPLTKKRKVIYRNGLAIEAPYYDINGHMIWGATAMIISEFESLLK